jgi:ABC-2 type transport system ATP-binding protein
MISVQNLCRRFGTFAAVDDLSLSVAEGEVLGFLGPNGAGKSTTMKMLTGFLAPTSGRVSSCGHDIVGDTLAAQRVIGYLPEGAPSYGDMSVGQYLAFIAEIRGFRGAEKQQRVDRVIMQLSLQKVAAQRIETLSKGFKRRVGLAQAIVHDPKVLILDEPTDGLDPNQKQQVRDLIANLAHDKIVIVSTHILEEVTAVCTRAVIINEGKLLFDGTPEQLLARSLYRNAVNVHLENAIDAAPIGRLAGVAKVETTEEGRHLVIRARDGEFIYPQIDNHLRAVNARVLSISVEPGRLDEVFQSLTLGRDVLQPVARETMQ